MAEARNLGASAKSVMHEVMDGVIFHGDAEGVVEPLLDFSVGDKAFGLGKASTQLLKLWRRQGRSFALGHIEVEQSIKATILIGGEPRATVLREIPRTRASWERERTWREAMRKRRWRR